MKTNFFRIFLCVFTLFIIQSKLAAQSGVTNMQPVKSGTINTPAALPGTYQIIKIGEKSPIELFTTDLLFTIESNRHSSQEIEIQIGEFTKVKILPLNVINAPGFIPLSEKVVVESHK